MFDLNELLLSHGLSYWLMLLGVIIIFCENAFVFLPNLPGDSLLFLVGVVLPKSNMSFFFIWFGMVLAAFLGTALNDWLGRKCRVYIARWCQGRETLERAISSARRSIGCHVFRSYITCRFVPVMRAVVPFVYAQSPNRNPSVVTANLLSAVIWVTTLMVGGRLLGQNQWVLMHLSWVMGAIIVLSIVAWLITHRVEKSPKVMI